MLSLGTTSTSPNIDVGTNNLDFSVSYKKRLKKKMTNPKARTAEIRSTNKETRSIRVMVIYSVYYLLFNFDTV